MVNHRRFILALVFLALFSTLPNCAHAAAATPPPEVIPAGKQVTFYVTVDGYPTPNVEWFKDGAKVGEGLEFIVPVFAAKDAGSYVAKATNEVGSATSDPLVTVLAAAPSKPTIRLKLTGAQAVLKITAPDGVKVVVN